MWYYIGLMVHINIDQHSCQRQSESKKKVCIESPARSSGVITNKTTPNVYTSDYRHLGPSALKLCRSSWVSWRWYTIDGPTKCSGTYKPPAPLVRTSSTLIRRLECCRQNSPTWRLSTQSFIILETWRIEQWMCSEQKILHCVATSSATVCFIYSEYVSHTRHSHTAKHLLFLAYQLSVSFHCSYSYWWRQPQAAETSKNIVNPGQCEQILSISYSYSLLLTDWSVN